MKPFKKRRLLFHRKSVQAILAGIKTETRRVPENEKAETVQDEQVKK